MNSPIVPLSQLPGQWLNQPNITQQTLNSQLPTNFEEIIQGYHQNIERKQKQCEYQKKYLQKKKDQFSQLANQVTQLEHQNKGLLVYYNIVQLLQRQHPQLFDQLIKQVSQNQTATLSPHIESPVINRNSLSPVMPYVSMNSD